MNTKLRSKQMEKLNSKLRNVWSYDAEQGEGKIIFSQENARLHVAETSFRKNFILEIGWDVLLDQLWNRSDVEKLCRRPLCFHKNCKQ